VDFFGLVATAIIGDTEKLFKVYYCFLLLARGRHVRNMRKEDGTTVFLSMRKEERTIFCSFFLLYRPTFSRTDLNDLIFAALFNSLTGFFFFFFFLLTKKNKEMPYF
jgi:hypothetical protein